MTRSLVVTMGLSLFYSASWENAGPFGEIPEYERWRDAERRARPDRRREWNGAVGASSIADRIRDLLARDPEAADVVDRFDPAFEIFEQYSAELTTLLTMRRKLAGHDDLASFLRSYRSIVLLHGSAAGDPTATAARHLNAVLARHLSLENVVTHALDGSALQQELASLVDYLHDLHGQSADLVATGGYKAFAVALGHVYWERASAGWRLFYLHESDSGELIQEWYERDRHRVKIAGSTFSYPGDEHMT